MTLSYRCSKCGAELQTSATEPEADRLIAAAPAMLSLLRRTFTSAKLPPKLEKDIGELLRNLASASAKDAEQ